MDLRDQFDLAIKVCAAWSKRQAELDELRRLRESARPKCGNCTHWMKSRSCPRETNVNGRQKGPSINAAPCPQFAADKFALKLQAEYETALLAFAKAGSDS